MSTANSNYDKDNGKEAQRRSSSKGTPCSSLFVIPSTSKNKKKDRHAPSLASKEFVHACPQSRFSLRRFRSRDRDQSPASAPLPLEESDSESITSLRFPAIRPHTAFTDDLERNKEHNIQIAVIGNDGFDRCGRRG
jgi:hypothetical protein